MATNHKPVIKGTDHGIWRRIKLIPFTTRIEEEKQDKHLEQKLMQESPGILNWLIEGAMRWGKEGLKTPAIILRATDEYRAEMDVIGNFIKERCVQGVNCTIKARELFKCYEEWCDDHNEHAVSERFLGLRLKEMGFEQKRSNDGRYWLGICLRSEK
jgi:putative DNA primase/helicase